MLSVLMGQEQLIPHSSHTVVGSTAIVLVPAWDGLVAGTGVGMERGGLNGDGSGWGLCREATLQKANVHKGDTGVLQLYLTKGRESTEAYAPGISLPGFGGCSLFLFSTPDRMLPSSFPYCHRYQEVTAFQNCLPRIPPLNMCYHFPSKFRNSGCLRSVGPPEVQTVCSTICVDPFVLLPYSSGAQAVWVKLSGFCNKLTRVEVHTDIKTHLEDINTHFYDSSAEPHTHFFHIESFVNTLAPIFSIRTKVIGMEMEAVWMKSAGVEKVAIGMEADGIEAVEMRMEADEWGRYVHGRR